MSFTPVIALGIAAALSYWCLMLLAAMAWGRVTKEHPEYGKALYTPAIDQALYRLGPLRWRALFALPVPYDVKSQIIGLRVAAAVNGLLGSAFVLCVFSAIFRAVRGG
ncbi:hypothetical protein ISN76_04810 [Dyella halodurans]|uniref:YggT family protein n=1 Tax=Dyella halodurans TaxID=1920171 RepID=A0ABV9C153_9GAMM|nr:hypothetical protein [Dyella halodurans]